MKVKTFTVNELLEMHASKLAVLVIDEILSDKVIETVLHEYAQKDKWAQVKDYLQVYEDSQRSNVRRAV